MAALWSRRRPPLPFDLARGLAALRNGPSALRTVAPTLALLLNPFALMPGAEHAGASIQGIADALAADEAR